MNPVETNEHKRLTEAREQDRPWKKWGPYLSERQWGTVREDYSDNGDAWDYFTHDQARSRAYRWGEDGLAGLSDDKQRLCFALALWNGKDPILKERLFGLTNSEANHGEDVKEYYFYLDSTPTHSYMKYLYKYPQAAYPYDDLVKTNRSRTREELEYELLDTGIFNEDRYFDVFVEYAKDSPEEVLIKISLSIGERARRRSTCCRPCGSGIPGHGAKAATRPSLKQVSGRKAPGSLRPSDKALGDRFLYCEGEPQLLFTENETNSERLFRLPTARPMSKMGSTTTSYTVEPRRSIRRRSARRRPPTTRSRWAAARRRSSASVCLRLLLRCSRKRRTSRSANASMMPSRRGCAKPMSFTKPSHRPQWEKTRGTSCDKPSRACCGRKQYYYFDIEQWLRGTRQRHRGRPSGLRTSATSNGSTWSTTTSSRCPTSGSTPGMRPGTWHSTRWPCPLSTRISPSSSST